MILEELIAKLGFKVAGQNEAKKFIRQLEDVRKALKGLDKGFKVNFTGGASGLGRTIRDFERAAAAARKFRQEAERAARVRPGGGGGFVPGRIPGSVPGRTPGRTVPGRGPGNVAEAGLAGAGLGLGRAGAIGASAYAGGRLVQSSVKSSMNFERSMIEVAKATDASGKELEGYGEAVMDLARQTGKNKEDLAGVLSAAGFAGRPKSELLRFTEYGAKASTAWQTTPEATGQAMAEIGNIYQGDQNEIERIGDQINTMADKSASKEADLLEIVRRVGGTGKTANLSSGDILAFGAGLKERGVQTEVASSGLESYINFLKLGEEYSSKADEGLKALGMTSDKLRKNFVKEPMDTAIDFLERINKITDPMKRAEVLTNTFGKERQDDVERMASSVDKIKEYRALMQNPEASKGSVRKQFDEQMKAEVSRIDQATQTLDTLQKAAGDYGKAALASAADLVKAAYAAGTQKTQSKSSEEIADRLLELNGVSRQISATEFGERFGTGPMSKATPSQMPRNRSGLPTLIRQPKGMPMIGYPNAEGGNAPTFGKSFSPTASKDWMRQGAQETTTNNITNNTNTGNDQRTQTASVTVNATGLAEVAALVKSNVQSGLSSMGASIVKGNSASTGASAAP